MAEHQIQRNRRTGEYRHLTERGWEPYTPMPEGTPERYLPGLEDTSTSAALGELGRTGKEAAIGLARSPLDALKGLFQLVTTDPRETVKGLASTVSDLPAVLDALGDNPREAGSLLGQLLLGKVGVPKIPGVVARVPSTVSAVGRGAEAAGTALSEMKVGGVPLTGLGATTAAMQGNWPGVAAAASPYALKYGGKGLQQVGGGLERLKKTLTPTSPVEAPAAAPAALARPARVSTEVPYRADIPESPRPSPPVRDNYSDTLGARRIPSSGNPLLDLLAPLPEGDAWAALQTLKIRPEPPMPPLPAYRHPILREPPTNLNQVLSLADEGDVPLSIPEADPLSRLDALRARQSARYGRTQPFRSESVGAPDLPAAWQPFTENPVTQDLIRVLEGLRTRPTPGLTNPRGF